MNQLMRFSPSVIKAIKKSSIQWTNLRNISITSSSSSMSSSLVSMTVKDNIITQQHRNASSRRRIRRRRDGGEIVDSDQGEEGRTNDPTRNEIRIATDKTQFLQASSAFLTKATAALEPMKAHNDVFNVQRSTNEQGETLTLSLKPSEGQYVLQADNQLCTLSLRSPMSGKYTYVLCKNTNKFVGMEDNHSIEGMIVRDLIRHCNGLPQF